MEQNNKNNIAENRDLMQTIEDFYLPRHLMKALCEIGHIPSDSRESQVGVGFIDVADYTRLSRFLSPKENQVLLNGLYTAFQIVLERHGGFLNKIEGDSMMFHFDDVIDRRLWDLNRDDRITFIARELFYTCIEMQRVCILFNQAHDDFVDETASPAARDALRQAFSIIKTLRGKDDVSSTLFAFFQIRIRIGANIGEVTIGNFGPDGSKHWDIIGFPVINAKRMESTAPVGGLRISAEFFHILEKTGIADAYFRQFRDEATKLGSVYRNIGRDELYRYREVVLHEKKGAIYKTYSVQVSPGLPEDLCRQTEELLNHDIQGIQQIIEFFRYYRANHFVIDELEKMLTEKGVAFRKGEIIDFIFAKIKCAQKPPESLSLFKILSFMDKYLDYVQTMPEDTVQPDFLSYDQYLSSVKEQTLRLFEKQQSLILHKTYFMQVVVYLVYTSLESSLREYQQRMNESAEGVSGTEETVEDLEDLEEIAEDQGK